jgi:hypothetical protein
MRKMKVFFITAVLVLVAAGVFAGKAKFFTTAPNIYYYNAGSYIAVATCGIGVDIVETTGTPATICHGNGTCFSLYYETGSGVNAHYYGVDFQ